VSATRIVVAASLAIVVATTQGCRPDPSTARGTAERFLDAHYVAIDLAEALPYTSGLAKKKVEDEMALVRGVEIDETTRKPVVHYTLLEEHPDDDGTKFLYRGDIAIEGADRLERQWLVTVRREGTEWRVTNYQESVE
jgi:hypothetical protein